MKLKIKYNRLNRGLYLLLLLALPLFSLAGSKEDALFAQGNQQYAKGQYAEAIQDYQQILNAGYQSAVVYYNTGNAYYKMDDMPSAILYYEKAHKLAPNDEAISINIQLANLKIADKIEAQPEFFVNRWWHSFILVLPAGRLAGLSTIFFIAGFGLLIWYLFTGSYLLKKATFFTGVVVILAGIIFSFMANRQLSYFDGHHQAIVFGSSVVVKGSPDLNGKPLFVIHDGLKVSITQTNQNWIEIQLPNGNSGWITVDNVKDI
jgi:hypothetical protein